MIKRIRKIAGIIILTISVQFLHIGYKLIHPDNRVVFWKGFMERFIPFLNALQTDATDEPGHLELMRVYDESEVEEVEVGEFKVKKI